MLHTLANRPAFGVLLEGPLLVAEAADETEQHVQRVIVHFDEFGEFLIRQVWTGFVGAGDCRRNE